jgi:hypothetical protein
MTRGPFRRLAPWLSLVVGLWLALRGRLVLTDGIHDDRLDLATPFSVGLYVAAAALLALGVRALRLGGLGWAAGAAVLAATLPYDWFAETQAAFAINGVLACAAAGLAFAGARTRARPHAATRRDD